MGSWGATAPFFNVMAVWYALGMKHFKPVDFKAVAAKGCYVLLPA